MTFQNSPYIYPLLLSAAITALLGLYAWRRRRLAIGAETFAWFMFAASVWALGSALTWASANIEAKDFWSRFSYFGVVAVPVQWFLFALVYTGYGRRLPERWRWLLWVLPVINLVGVWTNDLHLLFWRYIRLAQAGPITYLDSAYGPWFWFHSIYSYLLLLAGTVLLFVALFRSPKNYRGQAGGLLWGVLTPLIVNAATILGFIDIEHLDLTPFTFAISGVAFAWSLFRYQLLVAVPVAHEAVIESLDEPVIVLDARLHVVNCNPAALRLLGAQSKDVLGRGAQEVFAVWPELAARLRPPVDADAEVSLPLGSGDHPYSLHLATLHNQDGAVVGHLIHLRDIAEHKQTAAALQQTEQGYYAIVEQMGDPYFEADLAGRILYANRAFCESSGYPREDVVGRNFRFLTDRIDVMRVYQYFRDAYTTADARETLKPLEYVYRRRDGTRRMAELSVSLIKIDNGKPVGTRGILRDVTERKQAETALQQAKQAAEEASAAKSTFLANVSHELRTPLTSVLGFAKLSRKKLQEQIFPHVQAPDARTQRSIQQVTENLDIIVVESERLTALINNVLDLTKIEAGKVEWQMEPLSLTGVLEQALSSTTALVLQKRLTLVRDIPADLPEIVGDRDRLIQVVINLLSNAVKFTAAGSVTCHAHRADGEIVVAITDTGIGIAEADFGKVFDLFTQVGDTLTDKPTGTGLGLPICKQIVEHHGGRIWIESEVGHGSTFWFALPISSQPTPAPEAAL